MGFYGNCYSNCYSLTFCSLHRLKFNQSNLKVNGTSISNIRYADDTVLIAESEEDLQTLLDITAVKSKDMGLSLNVKKTECMVVSKNENAMCNIQSNGQSIKQVKKFKYLGYMITSDGRCLTEITKELPWLKMLFKN